VSAPRAVKKLWARMTCGSASLSTFICCRYNSSKAGSVEAAKCSMFAQSLAVDRLTLFTVTTHNVDGSIIELGPAAKKRGLHGPRPPHGTPTQVSGTLTILAVALGSCHARVAVASSTSIDSIFAGQLQLRTARFTLREPLLWYYGERMLQSVTAKRPTTEAYWCPQKF